MRLKVKQVRSMADVELDDPVKCFASLTSKVVVPNASESKKQLVV
jgi:hypothetical protein